MALEALERAVSDEIAAGREELVDLTAALVAFDTVTRTGAWSAREERRLQEELSRRLTAAGAVVDLWEPAPGTLRCPRQIPDGLRFDGYPQMLARFPGAGSGPTLLLGGHIDVVSPEPRDSWTSDPFRAEVRAGRLYGRGACDMKGGVAAMVYAAEVLARAGVQLGGSLLVNTVTDEESTSAGGVATVARGVRADASIILEPTSLRIGIACRGSMLPVVTVPGRAGHPAAVQPPWRQGGAVSAAEKAALVLEAVGSLRDRWRDAVPHPRLPPASVVATTINGGQWPVSYADSCDIGCHISYLPNQADGDGYGSLVEREFSEWIEQYVRKDPWLAEHPPSVSWSIDVPPTEVSADEPIVRRLAAAAADVGRGGDIVGADFWHDGATLRRAAGIPSVAFGPGDVWIAHSVDESVVVDDVVAAAQTIAVTAMRFCGLA